MTTPSRPNRETPTPFIFIHGWISSPTAYLQSLSALDHLPLTVHALTIPGHAGSRKPPRGAQAVEHVANTMAERIRPLAARQHVIVAGHSLGGALATHIVHILHQRGAHPSLLLLSPAGASPHFGPREWARAFGDFRQARPVTRPRPTFQDLRDISRASLLTGHLGWQARNSDLTALWADLAQRDIAITAVHASRDRVVETEPLTEIPGIQAITLNAAHDWPIWHPTAFLTTVELHLEQLHRQTHTVLT